MALVTTGLTVIKRLRTHNLTGNYARSLEIYADLEWTNGSDENHWIEISVTGETDPITTDNSPPVSMTRVITKARNSTSAARVLLTEWKARTSGMVLTRNITISVKATNGTTSSTPATSVQNVTLSQTISALQPPYYSGDGEIILPQVQGNGASPEMAVSTNASPFSALGLSPRYGVWVNYSLSEPTTSRFKETGILEIRPMGTTPLFKDYLGVEQPIIYIYGITAFSDKVRRGILSSLLMDGGFYSAKLRWPKPKPLTAALPNTTQITWGGLNHVCTFVEFNMSFEYWSNGKQAPAITSGLYVSTPVGKKFTYKITAVGAESFSSADFAAIPGISQASVNADTGEMVAYFATAGTYTATITATNDEGATNATLNIEVAAFEAYPVEATLLKNSPARVELRASHEATWTVTLGTVPDGLVLQQAQTIAPAVEGFIPLVAGFVGTPTSLGVFPITLQATKRGGTDTSSVVIILTIVDSVDSGDSPMTEIVPPSNTSVYSSDEPLIVGEQFSVGLVSKPSVASWSAYGLPSGISIDSKTGLISGKLAEAGRFSAVVTAQAEGHQRSLPVLIVASVDPVPETLTPINVSVGALARIPWLADEWSLIDVQVTARTKEVRSSLANDQGIVIKAGDDVNFAIFFMDSDEKPFGLEVDKLTLTVREAGNLEEPLVFETEETPELVTDNPDPYYLLTAARDGVGRSEMRDIVESWVARSAKTATGADKTASVRLPCVADVEWQVGGQFFSSQTFPVLVELDVTR